MFKNHRILFSCLVLAALFASGANAQTEVVDTVFVDPGTPGEGAKDFDIFNEDSFLIIVVWTGNKTLEWEAGTHTWLTPGVPGNMTYVGFLLDKNLDPIPDTGFLGRTPGGNDPTPLGIIELTQRTVFGGLVILTSLLSGEGLDMDWEWKNDDRPIVGLDLTPVKETTWGGVKQLFGE